MEPRVPYFPFLKLSEYCDRNRYLADLDCTIQILEYQRRRESQSSLRREYESGWALRSIGCASNQERYWYRFWKEFLATSFAASEWQDWLRNRIQSSHCLPPNK